MKALDSHRSTMQRVSRSALPTLLSALALYGCGETADPGDMPTNEAGPDAALAPLTAGDVRARTRDTFVRADWLKPRMEGAAELDPYLAPLVYLEVLPADGAPPSPTLPGALCVSASGELTVAAETPTIYFHDGRARIGAADHRQLSFVWFRTPRGADRPSAQGLRITFDSSGFPAISEVLADSSGLSVHYVSDALEGAALEAFGAPLPGCVFAVERGDADDERAVVAGTLSDAPAPMGPYAYQPSGTNDLSSLHCRCSPTQADEIREAIEYELVPLATLDGIWPGAGTPGFGPPDAAALRLRLPEDF